MHAQNLPLSKAKYTFFPSTYEFFFRIDHTRVHNLSGHKITEIQTISNTFRSHAMKIDINHKTNEWRKDNIWKLKKFCYITWVKKEIKDRIKINSQNHSRAVQRGNFEAVWAYIMKQEKTFKFYNLRN